MKSHSCEGVRGLKYAGVYAGERDPQVAFLRGSAWIEITHPVNTAKTVSVAFLRGSAWIEMRIRGVLDSVKRSHSCEGVRGLKFFEP